LSLGPLALAPLTLGLWAAAANAAPVTILADWTHESLVVHVVAPAGHHLAPEAPATLSTGRMKWAGNGEELAVGIRFPRAGKKVSGRVEAAVCSDADGTCVPFDLAFAGPLPGRRGKGRALPTADRQAVARLIKPHSSGEFDDALAQAARENKPVLIDFGAVWCPPCNLLQAQVLHDSSDAELLSGFVVVEVDVDQPASWPIKDRYDVGGYPTVVLANAAGEEQDRMVGYPGESPFKGWLLTANAATSLSSPPTPAELSPSDAADLARRLAGVQRGDDAAPYLARAEEGAGEDATDGAPDAALQLARLLVKEDASAAQWLLENSELSDEWLWTTLGIAHEDPAVAEALSAAAAAALPQAPPITAADLLYVIASLATEDQAPVLYGAAAATLGAALTGDAAQDRGHWTTLADLRQRAGDAEGARAILEDARLAYPDEMTFHYAMAGILLKQDDAPAALAAAEQAATVAYGDNALRVARRQAEALVAIGDTTQALAVIDAALAAMEPPEEGTKVRTFRYLKALQDARSDLVVEPSEP
jgi:thioredoxin-like negative regulator of GroEL